MYCNIHCDHHGVLTTWSKDAPRYTNNLLSFVFLLIFLNCFWCDCIGEQVRFKQSTGEVEVDLSIDMNSDNFDVRANDQFKMNKQVCVMLIH